MKEAKVIGLMSGTSLDGLDLAYVKFSNQNGQFQYQILNTATLPYSQIWIKKLKSAYELGRENLKEIDEEFGRILGLKTAQFIEKYNINEIDYISSHGQTIYHRPDLGYTVQIGNGQEMANILNLPVVYDFRTQDVELGGQGAPLVPIGDQLLFSDYQACLNLGGFANISFNIDNQRIAFDVSPVNIVFNHLANQLNQSYDNKGMLAKSGTLIPQLLKELNELDFYKKSYPKSLGFEWVEKHITQRLQQYSIIDAMHTFSLHVAEQINNIIEHYQLKNVLVTGGGAYNNFLIQQLNNANFIIPEKSLIEFKEAIIFAFMSYLKMNEQDNILASVTGANKNHSSGKIALPNLI